jgi:GH15 family glucan-1,4-alpha-glucosidase
MSLQIEDYALIGDLRTAALVGLNGTIDWLCLPRFDSPAVCAALLGDDRHGYWALAPVGQERSTRRRYLPNTLVLETEWSTDQGLVRVTDLMVPTSSSPMVVRIVDGVTGAVTMRTRLAPRNGYGKDMPVLRSAPGCLVATAGSEELRLICDPILRERDLSWIGDFRVEAGDRFCFALVHCAPGEPYTGVPDVSAVLAATQSYWVEWVKRSTYTGPWKTEVSQSLIILKALTYAPTGSILAAATTSLPERLGGCRNWDYRYSWLRDAAFTLDAFIATGYLEEARAWRNWLLRTTQADPSRIQITYAVDGATDLLERTLDWLPGHAQSLPVRVGNAAASQRQNDVGGEVLDILSTARRAGLPDAVDQEKLERSLLDQVEAHWQRADHGLWEVRAAQRHFVHSKLMAWVAIDRTIATLEQQKRRDASQLARLIALRRTIANEILDKGYDPAQQAFTQCYGSSRLDAAVLLMPRYGFIPAGHPRMVTTVDAIQERLTDQGLVRRYSANDAGQNIDGIPGREGAFVAASFWLADALHGIGKVDAAAKLFDRLLSLRNDVGLLSEEVDPRDKRQLGNTPQALSHAALVTTALTLNDERSQPRRRRA